MGQGLGQGVGVGVQRAGRVARQAVMRASSSCDNSSASCRKARSGSICAVLARPWPSEAVGRISGAAWKAGRLGGGGATGAGAGGGLAGVSALAVSVSGGGRFGPPG
ncbi:hypothetical protein PV794_17465, partial [Comamonas aquatica]|nr:hypothetical protein [Comamonas aquatica]